MGERSKAWEIAADLEAAAMALRAADRLLDAVHDDAQAEISECGGSWSEMADQLQALSAKYQAIADAEPEPGSDEWLKQSPQFHPGDLA